MVHKYRKCSYYQVFFLLEKTKPFEMADYSESLHEYKLLDIIDSNNLPLTVKISRTCTLRDEAVLLENQVLTILDRKWVHLICGKNWNKETFRLQVLNIENVLIDLVEEHYPNTVSEIYEIRNEVNHVYLKNKCKYGKYSLEAYTRWKIREINREESKIGIIDEITGDLIQLPISILFDSGTFVFINRKKTLTIKEFISKGFQSPQFIHAHYPHEKLFPEGVVRIEGLPIYDTIVTVTEKGFKLKYEIFPLHLAIKAYHLQGLLMPEQLSGMTDSMSDLYKQHLSEIGFSMYFNIYEGRFYGSLEIEGKFHGKSSEDNHDNLTVSNKIGQGNNSALKKSKSFSDIDSIIKENGFSFDERWDNGKNESKEKKKKNIFQSFRNKITSPTREKSKGPLQKTSSVSSSSNLHEDDLRAIQKSLEDEVHHKKGVCIDPQEIYDRQQELLDYYRTEQELNTQKFSLGQDQETENPLYGSSDSLPRIGTEKCSRSKPLPIISKNFSETLEGEFSIEAICNNKGQIKNGDVLRRVHMNVSKNHRPMSVPLFDLDPQNEYVRPAVDRSSPKSEPANESGLMSTSSPEILKRPNSISLTDAQAIKRDMTPNVYFPSRKQAWKRRNQKSGVRKSDSGIDSDSLIGKSSGNVANKIRFFNDADQGDGSRSQFDSTTSLNKNSADDDLTTPDLTPEVETKHFLSLKLSKNKLPPNKPPRKINSVLINVDKKSFENRARSSSDPLLETPVSRGIPTGERVDDPHIYEPIIYAQMNNSCNTTSRISDPLKRKELESLEELKVLNGSEVILLLQRLNLSRHESVFKDHLVTGALLIDSTECTFVEMGTTKFEARKLYKYIRGWRPKESLRPSFDNNNVDIESCSVHDISIMLQRIKLPNLATFCKENQVDGYLIRDLVDSRYIPKCLSEEYGINLMDIEFKRLNLTLKEEAPLSAKHYFE